MSHTLIRGWAKAAAILTFVTGVAGAAVGRHVPQQQPPLLLSLEFADSAQEVRRLAPAELRAAVMRAQRADSWLLIPSYWALFAASGVVMMLSGGIRNRAIGIAAIAAITAAAALDYRENAVIASALDAPGITTGSPQWWATGKWLLIFLTSSLVGAAFALHPRRRPHAFVSSALLVIGGAAGLYATLFAHALVQPASGVMAAGLLLLALLWIWSPESLTVRA